MFDEPQKEPLASESRKPQRGNKLPYILGGFAAILSVIVAILAYKVLVPPPSYTVPESVIKQASYPIFVPRKLPQGYKVTDGSFTVSEGTLVFRAQDSSGSSIAFTEQKKPANFDFEKFYQEQMKNAKRLDGTPYPSVMGTLPSGGSTLLSVVANDTWILASTGAPLGEQDFAALAKGLKQY